MIFNQNLRVSIFSILTSLLINTNLLSMQTAPTSNSISHLTKIHQLPNRGNLMRYLPPKNLSLNQGLPIVRLPGNKLGFEDRFGNVWVKGPSRTNGERFEWDVQLANKNKARMQTLAAGTGKHLNVSLTGRVTH